MAGFVHLHLHSAYSLLDGACRIGDIPAAAAAAGHTAVALTDHGVMYGAVEFYRACKAAGIRPIIGCEVYVAPRSRFEKTHEQDGTSYHLVLLVENEIGYRNLIAMVSASFTEGFYARPRVDEELLRAHREGLIALSGCLSGEVAQKILFENTDAAQAAALKYAAIFGPEHYYLELQDHGMVEQKRVNAALCAIAGRTGLPLVATNDVHYLRRQDAETQKALVCMQTGSTLADGSPLGFSTDEYYYKSTDEMELLFRQVPEALENTVRIAERCRFDFSFDKTHLPRYKPEDGSDAGDFLRRLSEEGLDHLLASGGIQPDDAHPLTVYRERMEYELSVIHTMGYDEYYLIVWDFVHYARTHEIPTGPGRGSGAGSLIAYLIGITEVDPIRYHLLFERFLNPERVSMPDFDIDFADEKRERVIEYVGRRYGWDHVSQIITFGTLAARAAVRDVGRVLGMRYADVDAVARLIPQRPGMTLASAMKEVPGLRRMREEREEIGRLLDLAQAVEGMPCHVSTHAAGVVITELPVSSYVPLAESRGTTVTQYDMDTVAALGLLKFDFLGLRYLTVLDDTEAQIRQKDPSFSLRDIPLDDAETFRMLSEGRADGVFQLESPGMKRMLAAFRPEKAEDIMVAIALYRPGPMDSIPRFLANRRAPEKITYAIPGLAGILDETCGCIVYQEQVMEICRQVAGYSFGRADVVRKAMAKKKAEVMQQERAVFLAGAVSRGTAAAAAGALFDEMAGFASYAFNKSHAAAYGLISYRTAYCKCRYYREYMAALLGSVLDSLPKMAKYVSECERGGVRILPPDVNAAAVKFCADEAGIRFGLAAVRNVGVNFAEEIVRERINGGVFVSFYDFIRRMAGHDMNKRAVEALIRVGGFDSLGINRRCLLAVYERCIEQVQKLTGNSLEGQIGMFDQPDMQHAAAPAEIEYPKLEDFPLRERLHMEKEFVGFYFSGHPLDDYTLHAKAAGAVPVAAITAAFEDTDDGAADAESPADAAGEAYEPAEPSAMAAETAPVSFAEGQIVTVAGMVARFVRKKTKKGDEMAFVTIEDRLAEIEVLLFPALLAQCTVPLESGQPLLVQGEISVREEEAPKLLAREVIPLLDNLAASGSGQLPLPSLSDGKRERPRPDARKTVPQNGSTPRPETTQPQKEGMPRQAASVSRSEHVPQAGPASRKLYLRLPALKGELYEQAENLMEIFDGPTPVIYYDASCGKYLTRTGGIMLGDVVLEALRVRIGRENVVLR